MSFEIINGDYLIRTQYTDSKEVLDSFLTNCKSGNLICLREDDWEDYYFLIKYRSYLTNDWFGIAIGILDIGIGPSVLPLDEERVLICHNNKATAFDLKTNKQVFDITVGCTSIFFTKQINSKIVIIGETDVIVLDANGAILSNFALQDIITDYKFLDEKVVCLTMEGEKIDVNF